MRGNYYFAGVMIKLESAGSKGGEMANIPGIVAKALIMAAGDWPSYSFFGGGSGLRGRRVQDCAQIKSSENEI